MQWYQPRTTVIEVEEQFIDISHQLSALQTQDLLKSLPETAETYCIPLAAAPRRTTTFILVAQLPSLPPAFLFPWLDTASDLVRLDNK